MNCIIAQSGGPTSVINSSIVGLVERNNELNIYKNVYAGLNGVQGILMEQIINMSDLSHDELQTFKYTPSSGLGSCRYKLKDFNEDETDYLKLLHILNRLDIKAFFYVGGNDSMDTIAKLNKYAKAKNIDIVFIGIPKTIDNDLMYTDHTPGFGSAAKFIATSVLETYLDSTVYIHNGVFILETMGRDTGWLTSSAALAEVDGEKCADLIYLPENPFDVDSFLEDVKKIYDQKQHAYIVVSEGIKDKNGDFMATANIKGSHDNFGHAQLGGAGNHLKELIISSGITTRVKVLELGVLQRCAMHISSQTDIDEAYMAGAKSLEYSKDSSNSGSMVAFKRIDNDSSYKCETYLIEADKVANHVKYLPTEWINERGNFVTEECLEYIRPLIMNQPKLKNSAYMPKYRVYHR